MHIGKVQKKNLYFFQKRLAFFLEIWYNSLITYHGMSKNNF